MIRELKKDSKSTNTLYAVAKYTNHALTPCILKMTLVTTLTDAQCYPKETLIDLYGERWKVEGYIREIKQTLSLDILRCKKPSMIEKEMCLHAIAYNLIRAIMLDAGGENGVQVETLSFKGTLDAIRRWREEIGSARHNKKQQKRLRRSLYETIVGDPLHQRPERSEPRAVKRRPKNYRWLTKPRDVLVVEASRKMK